MERSGKLTELAELAELAKLAELAELAEFGELTEFEKKILNRRVSDRKSASRVSAASAQPTEPKRNNLYVTSVTIDTSSILQHASTQKWRVGYYKEHTKLAKLNKTRQTN